MAQPISDEEIRLRGKARRRLVGAIVMVLVVAAVLPMILEDKPKPVSRPVDVEIPSRDEAPLPDLPSTPSASGKVTAQTTPAPIVTPAQAAVPKATEKPLPVATPAPKMTPPPVAVVKPAPTPAVTPKQTPATPVAGQFVVQVGAFADAANVQQIEAKIHAVGLKSYTDQIKLSGGKTTTRVRVGPFPSREAAEGAAARLALQGVSGTVMTAR